MKGWTAACHLRAGDILVTVNGEYVAVEQIAHELLEEPEVTYNFEVEDFHTYYVGNTSVLVHNLCKIDVSKASTAVKNVISNKQTHILQSKHDWASICNGKWNQVSDIIKKALVNGTQSISTTCVDNTIFAYSYNGRIVEVTVRVVNGVLTIVDAWVKTR